MELDFAARFNLAGRVCVRSNFDGRAPGQGFDAACAGVVFAAIVERERDAQDACAGSEGVKRKTKGKLCDLA